MKKYFLIFLPLIIFSCNTQQEAPANQSPQSPVKKLIPELSSKTKTDFKPPVKLPAGIETIFGKMPSKENGFYTFSFPRQDLNISLEGVKLDPRFAFTSWFAFMTQDSAGTSGMLMGEVVLLESECKNVLNKLEEKGME